MDRCDRQYCGWTGARFHGPLCRKLATFGRVRGLVFGPFGVSADLKWLVNEMAAAKAENSWRLSGARDVADAKRVFAASIRRTLGVAMVREQSRLKFDRINVMLNGNRGHSAAEYYGQRDMDQDAWDYYNRFGPQGLSGGGRGNDRCFRGG